jgi:transcriptional regulator with XRE-family HTH domain
VDADHSEAEPGGWPRWAAAVRDALARKSLSVNAAAEHLGVRNTTLRRWLDGAAPPQLSLLPRIAELTGLTHAIQLELGGVLPPAMRAEAHAIQVTSELRSAVGTIAEAVAHAGELAFSDAGARLAGILLSEEGADLQVTLRRAYRGRRYPVHLSTYVGVQRIHADSREDDAALRHRVTQIVGESARAFGAQWREQDPHDWRASTGTVSPTWPRWPPSTPGGTCTATASCPEPRPRVAVCGRCSTATAARKATPGGRWSPGPAACRPGVRGTAPGADFIRGPSDGR